ncbi:NAD(P)/FAD-dependent oxidoreductase [Ectothiorhodospira mobilis]|uniref:NAD(P)/FAD-dependent oxidoreductase n=1 Tax=Ectothiorhodospira mobilis TaxID=195064 RepID=UPI001905CA92|nr:FAD-dependent oxidoreductase [Ectothiorhodospira mobilis]MBK1691198.1 FAD-dependent oxidoreductase [Ectothiorhodospira mobilis]
MSGVLIIGTGLAGYTLAREWRARDPHTALTLVTRDDGAYYTKPMLSGALGRGQSPGDLVQRTAEAMAEELDARILTQTPVSALIPDERRVRLQDGRTLDYDALVLALGAEPIHFSYAGDAADAVLMVNDLTDYVRFRQAIEEVERVALIGPGLIGCEFANDLAASGRAVEVIGPDAWPLGRLVPEAAGQAVQRGLEGAGVRFHLGTVVQRIDRCGSGYRLSLKDGTDLEAGAVLSAVGVRPRVDLARGAGLAVQQGICVDRHLATSAAGVYALGDCAQVEGRVLPYVAPIRHAAKALARTLAGEVTPVRYPAMPVQVKTTLHPVVVAPPDPQAEGAWDVVPVGEGVKARFLDPGGRLLGFALTGTEAVKARQELTRDLPPILDE